MEQQPGWPLSSDNLIDEDQNSCDPWYYKHQTKNTVTESSWATSFIPPLVTERRRYSMDEPVSTMDDLNDLQGNTLVPNSPYLSCPNSPVLVKQKQPLVDNVAKPDTTPSDETDPSNDIDKRGNPQACIFVASLNNDKTDEELNISVQNHFEKWGNLINVKVFKDWMNRPYAFVQFERTSQAKKALNESSGLVLDGRIIRCEQARVNRTLCLSSAIPLLKSDIRDELSNYGPIDDIWTDKDNATCAYVKFCYRDDAIKAFLDTQKPTFSKKWMVSWCSNIQSVPTIQDTTNYDKSCVYIGNLDKDIQHAQVYDRFQVYGRIKSCNVIQKPPTDGSLSFGFVKYTTHDAATRAINAENGLLWYNRALRVSHRRFSKNRRGFNRLSPPKLPLATPFVGHARPHPPGLGMSATDAVMTSFGYKVPTPFNHSYRPTTTIDTDDDCQGLEKRADKKERTGYSKGPQVTYGAPSAMTPNQCTLADAAGLEAYDPTSGGNYWYPTAGDLSSYYQMYPHAGVYYFAGVPCMDGAYLQPIMMIPSWQPMVSATKDASVNNTCDLADDDK